MPETPIAHGTDAVPCSSTALRSTESLLLLSRGTAIFHHVPYPTEVKTLNVSAATMPDYSSIGAEVFRIEMRRGSLTTPSV